jgi:hypothetical protein
MIDLEEIKRDFEIRDKILEILYHKYKEQAGASRCSFTELTEKLGLESKVIEFNVRFLINNGFVEPISIPRQFRIAPKGVAVIEGPSKYNPPEDYRKQFIEIAGNVGQIIQAHFDFNPSVFMDQLNLSIENHPGIALEQKKYWKDFLKEIPRAVLAEIIQVVFRKAGL